MQQVYLDVSELEPPEPMTEIITALARLKVNEYLLVFHRREPFPLYEKLAAAGWAFQCKKLTDQQFQIFIYRATDQSKFSQQLLNKTDQPTSDLQ
ncbi:DUF2249 domain-containing protein [Thalassotalea psychrophila]|uniref:DUF2249 domain-containing protein n=1 Tax=Thalassotalea psychrophila TaxID=3065647 RepID=A0ABY9TUM9_9GAMM|nr:DUF2249 domain-containing protein [Colwelliaceae bacterium SQ149]